jgi:dethiobiotin synthetase
MIKAKSSTKKTVKNNWSLERTLPWLLTVGGAIGTLASVLLTIEVLY